MAARLRRLRATRQLLHAPAGLTATEVVRHELAMQAQDLPGARRALRARVRGLTADDVDREIAEERAIVVGWLGRGTLHAVCADDYGWMLGLTAAAQAVDTRRRLAGEGVSEEDADRAMRIIERALADDGPLSRAQLGERLAARGIRTEGQALPHLLRRAVLRGIAVRGPVRGARQSLALARDWLGARPTARLGAARRESALAELARRYLVGHGPATEGDLAYWIGLPLRDARAGLRAISRELVELGDGLVDLAASEAAARRTPPRLLPVFDEYLLGWRERGFAVADEHRPRIYAGGLIGPAVVADGRAVGTWKAVREGPRLKVDLEPFAPLPPRVAAGLRREREDLARFEGLELGASEGPS